MQYYSTDEKRGQLFAAGATCMYLLLLLALTLFVSFKVDKPQVEEGIMMDLQGFMGQPSSHVASSKPQKPSVKNKVVASKDDKILTQDFEEAPEIEKQKPKVKPKKVVAEEVVKKPVEKPREVNKNALFNKPKIDSEKSKGSATTKDNNSSGAGGYSGDVKGTGGGGVDSHYSVGNRKIVGSLPLPSTNYGKNKSGKVVIEVYVDSNGYVARTPAYKAQGSTTNDNQLIKVAMAAARKARFTTSDNEVPQVGTITYTFKLQ